MQRSAALMTFAVVTCGLFPGEAYTMVASAEESENVFKEWNFDDGIGSWENAGWDYQYSGEAASTSWDEASEALEVSVDFSNEADNSWSQIGIQEWGNIDLVGVSKTTFDFYFKDEEMTSGGFTVKEVLQYESDGSYPSAVEEYVDIDLDDASLVEEGDLAGYKKAKVIVNFEPVEEDICNTVFCIVGKNTTYSGKIYLDNIKMLGKETSSEDKKEDGSVDSTIEVKDGNPVAVSGMNFKSGNGATSNLPSKVEMVDKAATAETKGVYAYLAAVGNTDSVIYGHQDDTWQKAGSSSLTESDTKDVTGSNAGVLGIDTLSLTGNEYSATRYNDELAEKAGLEKVDTANQSIQKANVMAAARMTNYNISNGAIVTLSSHMPNFSVVKENSNYNPEVDPTYAKYDFSGYTPNTLTGDVANEILPGGKYNEKYNAFLDMIADYAKQVDGPIIFRPFHECTGSWFWWGAAFCDEEQYKNIFRYAVCYLRDEKDVHNIIYSYGPGSEAESVEDYALRYPGDEYVDMVGFDMYDSDPKTDEDGYDFIENFTRELQIVQAFATSHNKLLAITETGLASSSPDKGHSQTVLHKTGNNQPDWYNKMLNAVADSKASYMLLWANFGKRDGYYTPYVDSVNEDGSLHGHEMLDNFISFYNDERTIFANDQKDALESIDGTRVSTEAVSDVYGFILTPVAGVRVLNEISLQGSVFGEADKVSFKLDGDDKSLNIKAKLTGNKAEATLTEDDLKKIGDSASGKLSLVVDGKTLQTIDLIYNIAEPEEDPYEIDGFENYFGVDNLLTAKWATNKASGSSITLSHTKEKVFDGKYALEFEYKETTSGWAGATISKEVDWSDCDTLSFYVICDGKNQKTVVQLTANGNVYETYLNLYEEYSNAKAGTPLKVNIPFSDFCQRDTAGNPKGGLLEDSKAITSFGLWVNAIEDSDAVENGYVSGTLIYDKITAEKTGIDKAAFEIIKGFDDKADDKSEESAEIEKPSKEEAKDSKSQGKQDSGATQSGQVAGGSKSSGTAQGTNGSSTSQSSQSAGGAKLTQGALTSDSAQSASGNQEASSVDSSKATHTSGTTGQVQISKTTNKLSDKDDAADSNQANTSNEDSKVNDNNNLDKTEISKAADEQQIEDATVPATGKAGFNKVFILVGAVIAILAIAVVGIIRWKRM